MNDELEQMGDDLEEKTRAEKTEQPGFADNFIRGLHASAHNNASAYGYSVAITASFGILAVVVGTPTVLEIFAFAVGAVASVALVEAVASGGFRHGLEEESSRVRALGSSLSIFSVCLSLFGALAAGWLVSGWPAWPLGAFLTSFVYLLTFALEVGLADLLSGPRKE